MWSLARSSYTYLPVVRPVQLDVTEQHIDVIDLQHHHVPEALQISVGGWELLARHLIEIVVAQTCEAKRTDTIMSLEGAKKPGCPYLQIVGFFA